MIANICENYNYKKILFITHRQSLAIDFMRIFGRLGFCNYLDKSNFSSSGERLIVNIDSLHMLKETYNFFTEKSNLQSFDLVVLDECESLLKHFNSNLMDSNKDYIYSIFHDLISNTKKILCFDGDLSNRSYHYFKRFDTNIKIYENINVSRKYHYVIGYDEQIFVESIKNDLKQNRNCAIVSMSASFCEKINQIIGKSYETLMLIGKSDDELKKQMCDSETLLKTKRVLIYSPCITVGVDINFKHFDKLYGFVCTNSVCARDFMQMLGRIRSPTSSTITLLIDCKISKSKIANYYAFEEIKSIYANQYGYNPNDLTTYQIMRLWNKFEEINNKLYLFPILLHLIKIKGYTYEIKDEKPKKILDKILVDDIVTADNITEDKYNDIMLKQKNGIITQKERLSAEKYLYAKTFKIDIDKIDKTFMKSHYGKLNIIKNNKLFIKYMTENVIPEELNEFGNGYDNESRIQKMKYVKDVINKLGYININDIIQKSIFEANIHEMVKVINDKFRLLFDIKKEEVYNIVKKYDTNKKILGFLNSLINDYGVEIKAKIGIKYNKTTKKTTRETVEYKFQHTLIISNYE